MKLTRRQLNKITEMIDNEADLELRLRNRSAALKRKSMLNEALLQEVSSDDIPNIVATEIGDDNFLVSQETISTVDDYLFDSIARNITSVTGERISGSVLKDDMIDFDSDGMMEIQMELLADIAAAIDKYAHEIATFALHVKVGGSDLV